MAETIPGGYYHELNQKGEVVRAHNANGEELEILSDDQRKKLAEEGRAAPLKGKKDEDADAKAEQQAAASRSNAGKGGKK